MKKLITIYIIKILLITIFLKPNISISEINNKIIIDTENYEFYPIIKSKLGFARAVSIEKLPQSINFTSIANPRSFCSEIDFDDIEDENYAISIDNFDNYSKISKKNEWLESLITELKSRNIKTYFQIIGAPKPYQQKNIARPAIHPTPTDIVNSAKLTSLWAKTYLNINPSINWVIWNEPSHTLRGTASLAAVDDLTNIYKSYCENIDIISQHDQIGPAGFIAASIKKQNYGSFIDSSLNNIINFNNKNCIDFISINSYYGKLEEFLEKINLILKNLKSEIPIIITQFAPEQLTRGFIEYGSTKASIEYLKYIDNIGKNSSIEHACLSYYLGGNKSFVKQTKSELVPQRQLYAIGLYQNLPSTRLKINKPISIKSEIISGINENRIGILLYNASGTNEKISFSFNEIDKLKNKISSINLIKLNDNYEKFSTETTNFTENQLNIKIENNEIILCNINISNSVKQNTINEKYITNKIYVDRDNGYKNSYSYFDQIENKFYIGTRNSNSISLASASYETDKNHIELSVKSYQHNNLKDNIFFIIEKNNKLHFYGENKDVERIEKIIGKKINKINKLDLKIISSKEFLFSSLINPDNTNNDANKDKLIKIYTGTANNPSPTNAELFLNFN